MFKIEKVLMIFKVQSLKQNNSEKPIGFFPLSYNLAEMGRAILVAQELRQRGKKIIFFSHNGKYDYLAENFGFEVVKVKPFYKKEIVDDIVAVNRKEKTGIPYNVSFLRKAAREESQAYKKNNIDILVSFVNFTSSLSTRIADITHIDVSPGPGVFHLDIPDNYENIFTKKIIPGRIKAKVLNWFFYRGGHKIIKPFNTIAEEFKIEKFKNIFDLIHGDITLVTNFLEFINVFPDQQRFPSENYIGIILLEDLFNKIFPIEKKEQINKKIENHLDTENKKILLTMGSSGDKELFLNILKTLNKTSYTVIAVYGKILEKKELPILGDNIQLYKFVPSIFDIHKKVDLSIIHGGQGTVYTAAYAGKPVIGFPMQFEQYLNLEKMIGHGTAIMLSKKYYQEKKLLESIKKIFHNYSKYLQKSQQLAERLSSPIGEKKAAERIIEIQKKKK